MPLKHYRFFDLLITQGSSFLPEAEQVNASVTWSLLFFPPLPAFVASVWSGTIFQNRLVSSIFRVFSGLYSVARVRIIAI